MDGVVLQGTTTGLRLPVIVDHGFVNASTCDHVQPHEPLDRTRVSTAPRQVLGYSAPPVGHRPHLHFEVAGGRQVINPMRWLR